MVRAPAAPRSGREQREQREHESGEHGCYLRFFLGLETTFGRDGLSASAAAQVSGSVNLVAELVRFGGGVRPEPGNGDPWPFHRYGQNVGTRPVGVCRSSVHQMPRLPPD
jgi:hypothetical protein